jgi:hypothetical protein
MAAALFVMPYPEFNDNAGEPLANGSLDFGTPVYVDQALERSIGSTLRLNAAGRLESRLGHPVSPWTGPAAHTILVRSAAGTIIRTTTGYRQPDPTNQPFDVYRYLNNLESSMIVATGLHIFANPIGVISRSLANPLSHEEGIVMHIRAQTAFAHQVSVTGGYAGAGAGADFAIFGGAIGDGLEIIAVNGLWHITALRNVTLS